MLLSSKLMHSWGFALREGVFAETNVQQAGQAAAWSCELLTSRLRHDKAGRLGAGNAGRRCVRRVVGVGMGLPRHDGEVEGVVLSWRMMRFWYSASVAARAMLKRMSQNDDATTVFHECFRAGCCDMRNLSASLARP